MQQKVNNVKSFVPQPNIAVINNKLFDYLNNIFILNQLSNISSALGFGEDYFIAKEASGKSYLINNSSSNIINELYIDAAEFPYLGVYNYEGANEAVFNIYDKKPIFVTDEWIGNKIFKNYLFGVIDGNLFCKSIFNGNKLWDFSLIDFNPYSINALHVDIDQFVGIYQNILIIKPIKASLIGLDVKTGQIVIEIPYLEEFRLLGNLQLDIEEGIVFSIGPSHYIEFDLISKNYTLFDISTSAKYHSVEPYHVGSWEKNLIYFWEGSINNRFGIFDRDKKEIIWSAEIPEVKDKFPAIRNVKHASDKIYVHDHDNTLHIFDRE